MNDSETKTPPPYTTYKSFINLINSLREDGMPSHITRSMLSGSNSAKASMLATLKWLGLIINKDEPSDLMKQLADPATDYSLMLKDVLLQSYDFLDDPNFNIASTTTEKVAEKFKEAGASGSTVTKGIAFLLTACKAANIEVSKYVKAPAPERTGIRRKRKSAKSKDSQQTGTGEQQPTKDDIPEGVDRITVSLRNMDDGFIYFPIDLEREDAIKAVKAAIFMMKNFYDLDDEDLKM